MTTSFEARIELRPRTADETFDLALRYGQQHWRAFLRISLLLVTVATVLVVAALELLGLSYGAAFLFAIFLVPMVEEGVLAFAGQHLFQAQPGLGHALKVLARRLPSCVLLTALHGVPLIVAAAGDFEAVWIGIGSTLAVFWAFVMAPHFHLAEVSQLERLTGAKAMRRARVLVGHRFGRVLGMLILFLTVRGLFMVGTSSGVGFLVETMLQFSGVLDRFDHAIGLFGLILSAPYLAVVRLFDYVDARTRLEGWDIQVRFHAIRQGAEEAEAKRLAA